MDPINTNPIQMFLQQVKTADTGNAKEVKLDMASAKRLAFTIGEVMTRLNGDLETLLIKNATKEDEVIKVTMDGGTGWK